MKLLESKLLKAEWISFCTHLKNDCKKLFTSQEFRIQAISSVIFRILGPILAFFSVQNLLVKFPHIAFSPLSLLTSMTWTSICLAISFDFTQTGLNIKSEVENQPHQQSFFSKIKNVFTPNAHRPDKKLALFEKTILLKPICEKLIQIAFSK